MDTYELIKRIYGVATYDRTNPLLAAVGVAVVRVLPADPNRISIWISNQGLGWVMILDRPDVSATNGYRLNANGGHLTLDFLNDLHLVTHAWYAIAELAATPITVKENLIRSRKETV